MKPPASAESPPQQQKAVPKIQRKVQQGEIHRAINLYVSAHGLQRGINVELDDTLQTLYGTPMDSCNIFTLHQSIPHNLKTLEILLKS